MRLTNFTRTSTDGARHLKLYYGITLKPGGGAILVIKAEPRSREPYNTVLVLEFDTFEELETFGYDVRAVLKRGNIAAIHNQAQV